MFDFDKNQEKQNYSVKESAYIIKILDINDFNIFSTITKNKKELERLVYNIDEKTKLIYEVKAIGLYKDFKEVMRENNNKNKPDDLNFGQNE